MFFVWGHLCDLVSCSFSCLSASHSYSVPLKCLFFCSCDLSIFFLSFLSFCSSMVICLFSRSQNMQRRNSHHPLPFGEASTRALVCLSETWGEKDILRKWEQNQDEDKDQFTDPAVRTENWGHKFLAASCKSGLYMRKKSTASKGSNDSVIIVFPLSPGRLVPPLLTTGMTRSFSFFLLQLLEVFLVLLATLNCTRHPF